MQCLSGMGALSRTLVFSNANAPSFQTLSHWIYSRTLGISSVPERTSGDSWRAAEVCQRCKRCGLVAMIFLSRHVRTWPQTELFGRGNGTLVCVAAFRMIRLLKMPPTRIMMIILFSSIVSIQQVLHALLKMMVVLRLLTLFFPYLVTTNAFVSRRARLSSTTHRQGASSGPTNETQQGFNPFDLNSHKISMPSTSRISIRKTQMQELMSNLLNVAGDDEATQVLLEASKDLLLEPLEDDHAVLETDSIYQPDMTRQERYQTYRTTMLERIDKARNSNARWVLEKMSDYVLSHE